MSMPSLWVGTSWKMNKALSQATEFADALVQSEPDHDTRIQRFVVPPFTVVRDVAQKLALTSVMTGAQNMHWQDHGAWTGEISAPMLTDCGLDLVELGHSERRRHFGETDETVGLKVQAAVRHGLIPLICVGETMAEREAGQTKVVLDRQVRAALQDVTTAKVLLAYEPVWAIGAQGVPATAEYANHQHGFIKAVATEVLCHQPPCLYGGSVTTQNCQDLIVCDHIDGLFIGRAAWDVAGYLEILRRCSAVI